MIWNKRKGLYKIQTGFERNGVKESLEVDIQANGSAHDPRHVHKTFLHTAAEKFWQLELSTAQGH